MIEFKKQMSKKASFEQAVKIDEKHHPIQISYDEILKIIDEFVQLNKFDLKYSTKTIIDGYGNIAVGYNGNPYVTVRMLLMALRTHNNVVFFSKKYYAINTKIVETLNMILEKKKYATKIAMVEYSYIEEAMLLHQNNFNLVVYVGDKREYVPVKKKIVIPTIYCGYGNVDIYVENKDFKDLLLDIDQYARENNIKINYYDDTSIEDTIKYVNKYDVSDCFVLLSKNTDIIYRFMSEIKTRNLFVNKNPFKDYTLSITEKDLIYKKNISMN